MAVSSVISFGMASSAMADFPAVVSLSSLDGSNGFKIDGETVGGYAGGSLAPLGDINGDGYDDLIIGARYADGDAPHSGVAYVLFGSSVGFPAVLALGALDGSNGFKIKGESEFDYAGLSVDRAGDINGDGLTDILVGAPYVTTPFGMPDADRSGRTYVIFGRPAGFAFPPALSLSSLDGSSGFKMVGEAQYDHSGWSVGGLGDVNGDGRDDLMVGAQGASFGATGAGRSYVLFGRDSGTPFPAVLPLASIGGSDGFKIDGELFLDRSGWETGGGGDLNGDGIRDMVIGAPTADANGQNSSGRGYVVFGRPAAAPFPAVLPLAALDGGNGFTLEGEVIADFAGTTIRISDDLNGDGRADLLIGSPSTVANPGGRIGGSYVVFGRSATEPFPAQLQLAELNGNDGLRLQGEAEQDGPGTIRPVGDLNNDGVADIAIGAPGFDAGGPATGRTYVVYGRHAGEPFPAQLALGGLDGNIGFKIDGEATGDLSGNGVGSAGDINGDGLIDLLIGADRSESNGNNAGRAYVLFGTANDTLFKGGFE